MSEETPRSSGSASPFGDGSFSWSKVTVDGDAPTARSSHVAVLGENDTLIIHGGFGNGVERGDFFHVNLASMESSYVAPFDKANKIIRIGHAAVYINGQIYVFGGWNGKGYVNYGFLYSTDKMNMLVEKNKDRILPSARRDHSMTSINNKVYLFGGWNCVDHLNDVWVLSDSWSWSLVPIEGELPLPRRGHSSSSIGRKMYIFGGLYGFSRYLSDLHVLDTKTLTWYCPETTGEKPSPRAWHSSSVIGRYLIIFGGTAGRMAFFNDVYILDTTCMHWTKVRCTGDEPAPRCSHSATVWKNQIVVFGGITALSAAVDKKIHPMSDILILDTGIPIHD